LILLVAVPLLELAFELVLLPSDHIKIIVGEIAQRCGDSLRYNRAPN
jgi:hypothetical protein